MADINKVWLSGRAVSQPVFTKLPPRTPFTFFLLQVNETFKDRDGNTCQKPNVIRVESLGRAAEQTRERVQEGGRYHVEGYIRVDQVDGVEEFRVRTFAVYKEETQEAIVYAEGLKQALEILERSRDKATAEEELRRLIRT